MTEFYTFGSNLTQFLMRSHSIETADLEIWLYWKRIQLWSFVCPVWVLHPSSSRKYLGCVGQYACFSRSEVTVHSNGVCWAAKVGIDPVETYIQTTSNSSVAWTIALYCTILYYTALYYTRLYYTILYCTALYYTILYYTILFYTCWGIFYCTQWSGNETSVLYDESIN